VQCPRCNLSVAEESVCPRCGASIARDPSVTLVKPESAKNLPPGPLAVKPALNKRTLKKSRPSNPTPYEIEPSPSPGRGLGSKKIVAATVATVVIILAVIGIFVGGSSNGTHKPAAGAVPSHSPNTPAVDAFAGPPVLAANQQRFQQLKAQAAGAERLPVASTAISTPAPDPLYNDEGITSPAGSGLVWNGVVGRGRYIQLTSDELAIYDTALKLVSRESIVNLAEQGQTKLRDAQVIFDPATNRFYYAMLGQGPGNSYAVDYGFSKTTRPSRAADFCHYSVSLGTDVPRDPRLGGTSQFILIGLNNYTGRQGSAVLWSLKPSAASLKSCPSQLANGRQDGLPFTPVPAQQTDPSGDGYILASDWSGGSAIQLYRVTAVDNRPAFSESTTIPTSAYSIPADVPGPNGRQIGTLDNRLYQVIQSYDPRLNRSVLWTSLNTFAGAGSGVMWWELDPLSLQVLQTGTIADANNYIFDGSVAPDRSYVSPSDAAYGSNMVAVFNAASASTAPLLQIVSKRGDSPVSAPVTLAKSSSWPSCDGKSAAQCEWAGQTTASPAIGAATNVGIGHVWVNGGYINEDSYGSRNGKIQP
jgi:hypothetical protein